ncbi:MAG: hypothetical protein H5T99_08670 [Moorella sp. (in: Bacteria)]|nr:hypothetical protein [Moorella sp. (in: firmicutes)]
MVESSPKSSKSSFGKAAGWAGAAVVGTGALYAADQHWNDGKVTEVAGDLASGALDAATSPEGYGRAWDATTDGLGTAWNFAQQLGSGFVDLAQGPMNPVIMGFAAMMAGMSTIAFTKDRFDDVPGGAVGRLVARVGIALVVGFGAASFVGNLKDDPETQRPVRQVESSEGVPQPQQPQDRMNSLSFFPGGPGG